MKIAIISDIHDNLVNLEKCLAWCKKETVKKIICCGDVTNSETLGILSAGFNGEIFLVRGNMEIYGEDEIKLFKNYVYGGRTAIFEIGGKKVGVCHEPFLIKEVFASSAVAVRRRTKASSPFQTCLPVGREGPPAGGRGGLDIIFYGHTHKPWIEEKNGMQIANPGTLGGVFTPSTFAVWETESGKLELKLLNNL